MLNYFSTQLYLLFSLITRASIGRPEESPSHKMQAVLGRQMLCFAKKVLTRNAPYTFIPHTKMSVVFGKGPGPRIILLESQSSRQSSSSRRSRAITTASGPCSVWVQTAKTQKNRASMTTCGYCCCYLEHCSKRNHIAIKKLKSENVFRAYY